MDVSFGVNSQADLTQQYNDIREERLPNLIAGYCDIPSVWDASYAPEGIHSIDVGANVPFKLEGNPENWDMVSSDYGAALLEGWRNYTDYGPDDLLGTYLHSPLDIVRSNPAFIEGSPLQGSPMIDQLGLFRPAYGWSEYATPIEGLYVTGGSAAPMGGMNGLPGHHCATRIARDYKLPRWWAPTPGFDDK